MTISEISNQVVAAKAFADGAEKIITKLGISADIEDLTTLKANVERINAHSELAQELIDEYISNQEVMAKNETPGLFDGEGR
jgi:hypothetical protein